MSISPALPSPRPWRPSGAIRASVALHALAVPAFAAWPAGAAWIVGALIANHAGLTAAGMVPASSLLGPNLRRLPCERDAPPAVALTFDDGPDPDVTPRVLDLLDAYQARASFFCIGRRVSAAPALAREIVARGHAIENHSHDHPWHFAALGPAGLRRQIERARGAIEDATGTTPRYFRAPMGLRSPLLEPVLCRTGHHLAAWSRRGLDGVDRRADRVLRRLTQGLAAGEVLLMHDGNCAGARDGRPVVLDVLPFVLDATRAAGLACRALPSPR